MNARVFAVFRSVGVAASVAFVAGLCLFAAATVAGLHCVHCDRPKLTDDQFVYWTWHFRVMEGLLTAATLGLVSATVFGKPRRLGFAMALVPCALLFLWVSAVG